MDTYYLGTLFHHSSTVKWNSLLNSTLGEDNTGMVINVVTADGLATQELTHYIRGHSTCIDFHFPRCFVQSTKEWLTIHTTIDTTMVKTIHNTFRIKDKVMIIYASVCVSTYARVLHGFFSAAAAKRSPVRQMRPIKRSGDPDIPPYWSNWRSKNFCCQSSRSIVPDDAVMSDVWLSKYTFFLYF